MTQSNSRSTIIETMARAMCLGKACQRNCPDADHAPCPDALYSWQEDAERILTALESSGRAVVPREPTEAMQSIEWREHMSLAEIWSAMLSAALPPRSE